MKHILFYILFFFFTMSLSAQPYFKDESGSHPINESKLEKIINKTFKTPLNNDLEFRLHTIPALTNGHHVFVMRLKNKVWEAHFFKRDNSNGWIAENVDNSKLDSLWIRLEKNQVLTLVNQKEIEHRMKIFKADTTAVLEDWGHMSTQIMDGASYHFELTQYGYRKRAYSYHCPYRHLQYYPNLEELYRAYSIIILVYKHLGIPLSVC